MNISHEFDEKVILDRIKELIIECEKKKLMFSIAESCTGGYISHMITNVSGASKVFERGVVAYSNKSKIGILGVKASSIEKFGSVSEIIAKQMANGVRRISNTDIGIGVTGIAGPTGGTELKPVGLVYISYSYKDSIIIDKHNFPISRIKFKEKVLSAVITKLETVIQELK